MSFCGKTAAKHIEGFVNGCHPADMDDFVREFTKMHNTIEQKAVQLLIKTILRVSETPYPSIIILQAFTPASFLPSG